MCATSGKHLKYLILVFCFLFGKETVESLLTGSRRQQANQLFLKSLPPRDSKGAREQLP